MWSGTYAKSLRYRFSICIWVVTIMIEMGDSFRNLGGTQRENN